MNQTMRIYLRLSILMTTIAWHTSIKAQDIKVDFFTDTTIEVFDNGRTITEEALDEGFKLHVKKILAVQVQVRNAQGILVQRPPDADNATFNIYALSKEQNDGFVTVRLANDQSFKTLRIKIEKRQTVMQQVTNTDDCKSTISSTKSTGKDCSKRTISNKFGEDSSTYDENTIVYVYDFNINAAQRRFYKVYKDHDTLISKMVNFSKEKLCPGKNVYFKVVNANRYLYNVAIADTLVTFDSEPTPLFSQLFLGDSNILGGLLGSFKDLVVQQSTDNKRSEELTAASTELVKRVRCFLHTYNGMQAKMLQAYNPCSSFLCCDDITPEDYHTLANALVDINILLGGIQTEVNKLSASLAKKTEELKTCAKTASDLEKNVKDQAPLLAIAMASRTPAQNEQLEALQKKEQELKNALCKKEDIEQKKKDTADLRTAINSVSALTDLQARLPSTTALQQLTAFLNNMTIRQQEEVFGPFPTKGDVLQLTVHIASNDSAVKYLHTAPINVPSIRLEIPIIGRMVVSFSAGSFISVHKRLQNKTYDWLQLTGNGNTVRDSAFVLVESGYTAPPMGFAALGNIGLKLDRGFGLGLSAGVGLTIEKEPRPLYLIGGSVLLGNLRQFVITGGLAFMQVNSLTNNLQYSSSQQIIFPTKQSIDYYKEFKLGAFVSLTYTPFTSRRHK